MEDSPDEGDIYARYGSDLWGKLVARNRNPPLVPLPPTSPPPSREVSRESSLPHNDTEHLFTTTSKGLYDFALNSTPPTSPMYPSHWSPEKIREHGSSVEPRSPVKFTIPATVNNPKARRANELRRDMNIDIAEKGKLTSQQDRKSLQNPLSHTLLAKPEPGGRDMFKRSLRVSEANPRYVNTSTSATSPSATHRGQPVWELGSEHSTKYGFRGANSVTYPNNVEVNNNRTFHSERGYHSAEKYAKSVDIGDVDMMDAYSREYKEDVESPTRDRPRHPDGSYQNSTTFSRTLKMEKQPQSYIDQKGDYSDVEMEDIPSEPIYKRRPHETCIVTLPLPSLGDLLKRDLKGVIKETMDEVFAGHIKQESPRKVKVEKFDSAKSPKKPKQKIREDEERGRSSSRTVERRRKRLSSENSTLTRPSAQADSSSSESNSESDDELPFIRKRRHRSTKESEQAVPDRMKVAKDSRSVSAPRPTLEAGARFRKQPQEDTTLAQPQSQNRLFSSTSSSAGTLRSEVSRHDNIPSVRRSTSQRGIAQSEPSTFASRSGPGNPVDRSKPDPNTGIPGIYWFQRYYNELSSEITKPKILPKYPTYFKRPMISHYLGGNPRLTVSSVSDSAQLRKTYAESCVVCFPRGLSPIDPSPGGVIVMSTIYNWEKQLPKKYPVETFPVFIERDVGRWEYMGTYKFDKFKDFSGKELRELQTKGHVLIECWLDRIFQPARNAKTKPPAIKNGRIIMSEPEMSEATIKALVDKLYPDVIKKKSEVSKLTRDDVKKLFIKGDLKLSWCFLKPVGYNHKMHRALCNAEWPIEKKKPWEGLGQQAGNSRG
ncbi:hypothetical protein ABW19_dt0203265 [Dactylella cylindrospora]|nr:hypothetical protein ABW19_dt0203265 [Dactylella cylindrospora]